MHCLPLIGKIAVPATPALGRIRSKTKNGRSYTSDHCPHEAPSLGGVTGLNAPKTITASSARRSRPARLRTSRRPCHPTAAPGGHQLQRQRGLLSTPRTEKISPADAPREGKEPEGQTSCNARRAYIFTPTTRDSTGHGDRTRADNRVIARGPDREGSTSNLGCCLNGRKAYVTDDATAPSKS